MAAARRVEYARSGPLWRLAVGIIVILTGLRVLRDASLELMDTIPSRDMMARVRAAALDVPGVLGVDKSDALPAATIEQWQVEARPDPPEPRVCIDVS